MTQFCGCLKPGVTSETKFELMCCKFNQAGDLIATGNANGVVTVFQPHSIGAVYELRASGADSHLPVTGVHFRKVGASDTVQNNILLASYSSGYVRHWHVTTGQCLSAIKEDRQTLAAAYSPDYQYFVTAGSDCKVLLYDESTLKPLSTFERSSSLSSTVMDGHASRVFAVRYHPSDPTSFLSAGWDDTVQFWDTRQSRSVRRISGPHICGDSLDIDPATYDILTGSWTYSDTMQVWDFASGKLLSTFRPQPECKVYAACWLTSGVAMIGGTHTHLAMVVDVKGSKVLGAIKDLEHSVYGLDYHQRSNTIALAAGTKLYSVTLSSTPQTFLTQED